MSSFYNYLKSVLITDIEDEVDAYGKIHSIVQVPQYPYLMFIDYSKQ